ncbi:MAG: hypothetical protein KC502_03820 [Myxococcales bacterium]|nr:hypothetical protein [Myxococcales bacterium]
MHNADRRVHRSLRRGMAVTSILIAMGLMTSAFAAPPAASGTATFQIRVIEAAKGPAAHLDPRLGTMKRDFKPFKGQFNQFKLVRQQTLRLAISQQGGVQLPTGKRFGLKMLGFTTGKVRRIRYEVQMPRTRMKRSVAPGARTLDVIRNGPKLIIISTTVR